MKVYRYLRETNMVGRSGILGFLQLIRIRDLPKNSHVWKPDCDADDPALMHRLDPKFKHTSLNPSNSGRSLDQ